MVIFNLGKYMTGLYGINQSRLWRQTKRIVRPSASDASGTRPRPPLFV